MGRKKEKKKKGLKKCLEGSKRKSKHVRTKKIVN